MDDCCKKFNFKKFLVSAAVIAGVVALAVLVAFSDESRADSVLMDTVVSVSVKGLKSGETCSGVLDVISSLSDKIDRFSPSSEINSVNGSASFTVSGDTAEIIGKALGLCAESGGALDISIGAVSDLWGFGGSRTIPSQSDIGDALSLSGFDKIGLDGCTVTSPKGLIVDLGSVGKGAACNQVRDYLSGRKVRRAVVAVGGSILLYGKGDFTVGVQNPFDSSGDYAAVLTLPCTCVSTSGNYERFFEKDGIRYHHILSPETGYPCNNGIVSVTIICDDGEISDALSTACFVAGIEKAEQLCSKYDAEYLIITESGEIFAGDSLRDKIQVGSGFELK